MQRRVKMLVFAAAVIGLLGFLLVLQALRNENEVALFITGGTEGFLVPCGCRTSPAGGISRRVTLIEGAKAENPSRKVIPVELPPLFMDRGPAKDLINRAFGEFLESRGYLVSPGPRDLQSADGLRRYYKGGYCLAGEEGFRDGETVELGGYRHLPFGKKGRLRLLFISETGLSERKLRDPLPLFREKIREAPEDAYIVMGNLSPVTIQEMVKEKVTLLAAVSVWGHTVTSLPQRAGSTWAIFLGDKGRRYVLLEIGYFDGRWEAWPKTDYINRDVQADPETEKAVQSVLKKAEVINAAELEKKLTAPSGPSLTGSASCGKCHEKEYAIWKQTRHSSATGTLEIDHQEGNPECLICHTTAFGKGGYPDRKELFGGVGCESCHEPGEGHPPRPQAAMKQGQRNCGSCHTKRDSPNFNEEIYFRMMDHGPGGRSANREPAGGGGR